MLKARLDAMWHKAMSLNKRNILKQLSTVKKDCSFLDLGCDDGEWTAACAASIHASEVAGVDIVEERLALASRKGVKTIQADLNQPLPIQDESYDALHANQVIEHVGNVDLFAAEIMRILKPGGVAVVSTENASSWCNVFASMMGWQIFSLTNVSMKSGGIGNPLALHRGKPGHLSSWTHKTIFNYRGLIEFFAAHGFRVRAIQGAGYFPLPASLGLVDARHAHFLAILLEK